MQTSTNCKTREVILRGIAGHWNERSPLFFLKFPDLIHLVLECSTILFTSTVVSFLKPAHWNQTRLSSFYFTMLTWRSFSSTNAEVYEIGFWAEVFGVVLWTCNGSNFEHSNQTNQNFTSINALGSFKGHQKHSKEICALCGFDFSTRFIFAIYKCPVFIAFRKSLPQK